MKNKIITSGLILLMTLSTFGTNAGSLDSTRKDTCCTKSETKNAATRNDEPVSVPDATRIASHLQDQVALADAEMTFTYIASQPVDKDVLARADALTNLEMAVATLEPGLSKMATAAAQDADQSITMTHQKAVSVDLAAFRPENVAKMLIDSDRKISQQYASQNGMVVAIVK